MRRKKQHANWRNTRINIDNKMFSYDIAHVHIHRLTSYSAAVHTVNAMHWRSLVAVAGVRSYCTDVSQIVYGVHCRSVVNEGGRFSNLLAPHTVNGVHAALVVKVDKVVRYSRDEHVVMEVHWRSDTGVAGVSSYSVAQLQFVSCWHTLSDTGVSATASNCSGVHTAATWHTRSVVAVGGVSSNWLPAHKM
jgi:hypothetical protein